MTFASVRSFELKSGIWTFTDPEAFLVRLPDDDKDHTGVRVKGVSGWEEDFYPQYGVDGQSIIGACYGPNNTRFPNEVVYYVNGTEYQGPIRPGQEYELLFTFGPAADTPARFEFGSDEYRAWLKRPTERIVVATRFTGVDPPARPVFVPPEELARLALDQVVGNIAPMDRPRDYAVSEQTGEGPVQTTYVSDPYTVRIDGEHVRVETEDEIPTWFKVRDLDPLAVTRIANTTFEGADAAEIVAKTPEAAVRVVVLRDPQEVVRAEVVGKDGEGTSRTLSYTRGLPPAVLRALVYLHTTFEYETSAAWFFHSHGPGIPFDDMSIELESADGTNVMWHLPQEITMGEIIGQFRDEDESGTLTAGDSIIFFHATENRAIVAPRGTFVDEVMGLRIEVSPDLLQ